MNSITNKGLLVECEFSVGKNDFLVKRGMKPHLFEIYQNNVLINQNSSVKDYQDLFEKQILKLSFKSFGQIVVLGSANYLPFMQLPAHARREVIEDLLDIQIFSTMNTLLKEKIIENRSDINEADHKITLIENKIELAEKHIVSLRTNNDDLIKAKQESDKSKILKTFTEDAELQIINGRYGPYISYKKGNIPIPKGTDSDQLDYAAVMKIVEKTPAKKAAPAKKAVAKKAPGKKAPVKKKK
jgi:DNA repair exonuclease SbcCD ATPase subunit